MLLICIERERETERERDRYREKKVDILWKKIQKIKDVYVFRIIVKLKEQWNDFRKR